MSHSVYFSDIYVINIDPQHLVPLISSVYSIPMKCVLFECHRVGHYGVACFAVT